MIIESAGHFAVLKCGEMTPGGAKIRSANADELELVEADGNGKETVKVKMEKMRNQGFKRIITAALIGLFVTSRLPAAVLKLSDAPLSQLDRAVCERKGLQCLSR
ncbi:hypothetical protein MASR1M12_11700 [Erysipelotrichia bacterium]